MRWSGHSRRFLGVALVTLLMVGCSSSVRYAPGESAEPVASVSIPKTRKIPPPREKATLASRTRQTRRETSAVAAVFYGKASYYGPDFHGKTTANGERFDMYDLTAAHKTLPFNTRLRVTNLDNDRSVTVRVNDRGPYKKGRIVDLSFAAAKVIGLDISGVARVKVEVLAQP